MNRERYFFVLAKPAVGIVQFQRDDYLYERLFGESLIAAERGSEKIAVEIKSFLSPSLINDLETAWGQFFMYARALQRREPERRLYLAVSRNTFETLFQEEAGQLLLEEPGFRMIVFDSKTEEIIQWKP